MLKHRSTEKEQLDNLEIKGEELDRTLDGLSVINKLLGNTNATFNAVKPLIMESDKPLTIIDLGCGGGDNLRRIGEWCSNNNFEVTLIGIDGNANILKYAAEKKNNLGIEYIQLDILDKSFELPPCNILISSHFMYHFSDDELVTFLKNIKPKVSTQVIFSELERNLMAYILFRLGSWLMPFTKMVKQDGLKAIERAFTKDELKSIFRNAEIDSYSIKRKWAFRFLVKIEFSKELNMSL